MMPACRMAPPRTLRKPRAWRIASAEPARAEPTGAPSPLEKQIETVSKCLAHSRAGMPVATTAFISRAPSRCMARWFSRAQWRIASMLASGWIRPPPRLCVFSSQTSRVRT